MLNYKEFVFGMGSGRCGTVSLAKLLNSQSNSNFEHESSPRLTWKFDKNQINSKINNLKNLNEKYVGDVAFYYLPYVEHIISNHSNAKFVVLKRDKKETINSFMKKTEGRNHWIIHDGKKWKKDKEWDDCFPKYDHVTKEKALETYWEEYYKEVNRLLNKYPSNIKIWETEDLNSEEKVKEILNFANISKEDQRIMVNIQENKNSLLKSFKNLMIKLFR